MSSVEQPTRGRQAVRLTDSVDPNSPAGRAAISAAEFIDVCYDQLDSMRGDPRNRDAVGILEQQIVAVQNANAHLQLLLNNGQ